MAAKTIQLQVRVSADTKERLVADAAERGCSLNDLAVGILAEHFRVSFARTGRPSTGVHTSEGQFPLRVPAALYRKIHAAAVGKSKIAVVEAVLRSHYERADERDRDAVAVA